MWINFLKKERKKEKQRKTLIDNFPLFKEQRSLTLHLTEK